MVLTSPSQTEQRMSALGLEVQQDGELLFGLSFQTNFSNGWDVPELIKQAALQEMDRAGGVVCLVKPLPSMHEALCLSPRVT